MLGFWRVFCGRELHCLAQAKLEIIDLRQALDSVLLIAPECLLTKAIKEGLKPPLSRTSLCALAKYP